VVDYLIESERPYSRRFDDAAARATAERVFDRSRDTAASATNPFLVPAGAPWRERLAQIAAPLRHSRP
jgi:hypothetical protein